MTVPNYLGGKKSPYDAHWSKRATRGDVLAEQHRKANPEPTPWQERPVVILIALVAVMLGAGLAGWAGLTWVNSLALETLDLR